MTRGVLARFAVKIEDVDGTWDMAHVAAPSPDEAVDLAVDWIDYVDRRALRGRPSQVQSLPGEPISTDLGVASDFREVMYMRIDSSGRPLDTIFRPASDFYPGPNASGDDQQK